MKCIIGREQRKGAKKLTRCRPRDFPIKHWVARESFAPRTTSTLLQLFEVMVMRMQACPRENARNFIFNIAYCIKRSATLGFANDNEFEIRESRSRADLLLLGMCWPESSQNDEIRC